MIHSCTMTDLKKLSVAGVVSLGMGLKIAAGESEDDAHPDVFVPRPFEVRLPVMVAATAQDTYNPGMVVVTSLLK